ncbi:MAG: response regulator [Nostocaceae cyanobacterium]|nr:response regulator [Nostocaceae cyanobacterium]
MGITLVGKILIVEDSPSELELMGYYLTDSGYKIIKASDAKKALEIALAEKPDIIITDIVMPEMSGFELCRHLKRNPGTTKVPIIVCSSKNQPIDRLWAIKQGADFYITKPYTREELVNAIESMTVESMAV